MQQTGPAFAVQPEMAFPKLRDSDCRGQEVSGNKVLLFPLRWELIHVIPHSIFVHMKLIRFHFVVLSLFCRATAYSQSPVEWKEKFEAYENGHAMTTVDGWEGFRGYPGKTKPTAIVLKGKGIDGSNALSISHHEVFRTDSWGLQFQLPQTYKKGAVWIQCKFKPPSKWSGRFTLDARGDKRAILTRIAGTPYENKATRQTELRWHCTWNVPHWRLFTLSKLDTDRWYTITARLDLDGRTCAAWLDDQPLGEEAPLSSAGAFTKIHLGFGGLGNSLALVDDLVISRKAPNGFAAPKLLPGSEDDIIFRFAGLGDPQLGFGGYEADKARFTLAVNQINRAGADLSLILGDMVHDNKAEQAYQDLAELANGLKSPKYIRGNHEELDLFQKYFNEKSNYSFVHKGLRFVVIDAIGNQRGLSNERLAWIELEFATATKANEEIVLALHVSPWQNNKKGAGKYNQIGPGRDRLRQLMKQHKVLLCLSGHYHSALWHGEEEQTHYLVLGGTAIVSGGTFGWCLFDVYPDRIVMHHKPLFYAYEKPGVTKVHGFQDWIPYETLRKMRPYTQQGPLTIKRHRPVK